MREDYDPAADTAMFRAFVEKGAEEEARRSGVGPLAVVALVSVVLVAGIAWFLFM
ncbi:hypothetical protein [Carbonactinospora thermoautotrophica]|uniref:Uncharacterized protein n=1 Tax=Carbonactinospora thermoautotrophica TaxID=1469144 RepID=A0A132MTT9_9ACTN|nr:hypothetical protein [Carbonactinospora thermoautotrophica]KWX01130.1 hypothetical protein LI90_2158 [Carbonactinospora thermoautotrophica]